MAGWHQRLQRERDFFGSEVFETEKVAGAARKGVKHKEAKASPPWRLQQGAERVGLAQALRRRLR